MVKSLNIDTYKRLTEYSERKKRAQLLNTTIPLRLKLLRNRLEKMDDETQQNKKRNQRRNKKKSSKKKQNRDARNA